MFRIKLLDALICRDPVFVVGAKIRRKKCSYLWIRIDTRERQKTSCEQRLLKSTHPLGQISNGVNGILAATSNGILPIAGIRGCYYFHNFVYKERMWQTSSQCTTMVRVERVLDKMRLLILCVSILGNLTTLLCHSLHRICVYRI